MSSQATESHETGVTVPDNNNTLTRSHQPAVDRTTPPAAGATGPPERQVAGWVDAAELSAALRGCSSSSDDCSKGKLEERFSLTSYTESGFRTPVCRICFQGPEHGELLSPCRCSGSVRCTHQPCLIKWISERGSWACELCYYKYQVIAISTKNPLQWQAISLTVIEKVQIAAAILGSLFLMASISWLVWSSFSPSARWQRQDLLFQICYGMYGFMDVVCIALIVHEGPSVFRIFHRWQAVNQQWKVLNYDKSMDSADLKDATVDRTLSQPNQGYQTGIGVSTSTSSLMVVASTATGSTSTAVVTASGGLGTHVDPNNGSVVPDQHCPYNILHLLSHLRQPEPRSQPSNSTRELVMRVTTV
ncbi:membrane associated ring-CH-type finger 4 isoform X2 [Thunnus albacares]|nr:membrane associated ring-CH-type finger 4 isoform X2 [Thunnus maccoyii]XP_042282022.1 membrane associated ring-CH-type finger 4 isoform X2 [Thunnus maccoyii]XP_044222038.1 membrane associated ring-CH-type finger 4 isoform X2 [Thunnus albacares]XP_044222039.1 membrane associated ring-CH-type finger 4 isoform X2 [Thunnus albacares]